MLRSAILAALIAAPASAQRWGELDCKIVQDYVAAARERIDHASIAETINSSRARKKH
jgi:hypothetical protein